MNVLYEFGEACASSSPERLMDISGLSEEVDTFVFDCDGVIWKADELIDGVSRTLNKIRQDGKKIFFVTNNSAKSRAGYLKKFHALGLNVFEDEILSCSFAAAAYLQAHPLEPNKKAYVIGQSGICDELALLNIPFIDGSTHTDCKVDFSKNKGIVQDPDVQAVIVGFDPDINYYKLQYAQLCLNENKDCRFIATNLDTVAHLTSDQEWAEAGCCVGAIQGCTDKKPILVGKPSALLIDYIVQKYHTVPARMCMVGDRLDTDIAFGKSNGLRTILTLSGVTTQDALFRADRTAQPEFYVNSIADFYA
eukprot:gene18686-21265_t